MEQLTDLEICKRIAEIEGLDFTEGNGKIFYKKDWETWVFNPLTDDALNHQLMSKFECSVINVAKGMFIVQCEMSTVDTDDDTNLNKAILLAIIEANKES